MANSNVDGHKNCGVLQKILALGCVFFSFLKKIGVARTGGMVDTFDD